jgi:hypothetical protein
MTLGEFKRTVKVGQLVKPLYWRSFWSIREIKKLGVVVEHPLGGHKEFLSWTSEIEPVIT